MPLPGLRRALRDSAVPLIRRPRGHLPELWRRARRTPALDHRDRQTDGGRQRRPAVRSRLPGSDLTADPGGRSIWRAAPDPNRGEMRWPWCCAARLRRRAPRGCRFTSQSRSGRRGGPDLLDPARSPLRRGFAHRSDGVDPRRADAAEVQDVASDHAMAGPTVGSAEIPGRRVQGRDDEGAPAGKPAVPERRAIPVLEGEAEQKDASSNAGISPHQIG